MTTRFLTICTVQPAVSWGQPQQTFAVIDRLLDQAAKSADLDIVVLPEHVNGQHEEAGEALQFELTWNFAANLARRLEVNLVAGSVERWDALRSARVNTALLFDREGQEVSRYDKQRLFGFEVRRGVQPGQEMVVAEFDGVHCGVLICSDLWHPELVRDIAAVAEVLCVPAQTAIRPEAEPAYARLLWHSLAMTRAQENVMAVAVSDHSVESIAPYRCGGVATIVDPGAEPNLAAMQQVLAQGQTGALIAQINLSRLAEFRQYRQENGLLPAVIR